MKKRIIVLLLLIFFSISIFSQNYKYIKALDFSSSTKYEIDNIDDYIYLINLFNIFEIYYTDHYFLFSNNNITYIFQSLGYNTINDYFEGKGKYPDSESFYKFKQNYLSDQDDNRNNSQSSHYTKLEKNKIIVGGSRPLTGELSDFEITSFGPIYKLWAKEINAKGGIYVKEYDKRLPVELKIYDDESDINKMVNNLYKLIVEDKVDLLIPPCGTDMLFAAAPIINEYKYVLIGAEGGSSHLSEIMTYYPYLFSVLNYSEHAQVPALIDILVENDIKTTAIVYLNDLYGVEYFNATLPQLKANNIDVLFSKSISLGINDLSPIIKEAKDAQVDAFLVFANIDENILAISQSIELSFNPKLFLVGTVGNYSFFANIFGTAIEGIISLGAWNAKSSSAHKKFADKMAYEYGDSIFDWWGHNVYYASLQLLQEAIEEIGTLDQTKLRGALEKSVFQTVLGDTWFNTNHLIAEECYAGQIGQWQNDIFEVVSPTNKATASLIYPKPIW